MFDQAFCEYLEYAISGVLGKSADVDYRRCWCDGILLPEEAASISSHQILKAREVATKAWIDEGRIKNKDRGQFLYGMRIHFGDDSAKRLRNNERLEESVPDTDPDSWIFIDRENKLIEIQLP
jgi:hypothetical protein